MQTPYKSRPGWRRLAPALIYAIRGLGAAFRHEASFRQELLAALLLSPVAFIAGTDALRTLLLLGALWAVLVVELLNSAIETLADAVTADHHPLIGRAKDIGSAAVLLTMIMAAATWVTLLVF